MMDYSFYPTAQTPYQFLGFTPESNGAQQIPRWSASTGTTPPSQNQQFNSAFESFDQSVYGPSNLVPSQLQHQQSSSQQSPVPSISPSNSLRNSGPNFNSNSGHIAQNIGSDLLSEEFMGRARSSSEEKDSMTPAQSKRKAQNRAAQRAFRERKERHVKELEAKLNNLEKASTSLHDENERLKRELVKVATENEILRATTSSGPALNSMRAGNGSGRGDDDITKTGPINYTPTDFLTAIKSSYPTSNQAANIRPDGPTTQNGSFDPGPHVISHNVGAPLISSQGSFTPSAHRITISARTGKPLFSAGAAWDYIQAHPLFKEGSVDIADVSERLKGLADCDGAGPSFEEGAIMKAIEESAAMSKTN